MKISARDCGSLSMLLFAHHPASEPLKLAFGADGSAIPLRRACRVIPRIRFVAATWRAHPLRIASGDAASNLRTASRSAFANLGKAFTRPPRSFPAVTMSGGTLPARKFRQRLSIVDADATTSAGDIAGIPAAFIVLIVGSPVFGVIFSMTTTQGAWFLALDISLPFIKSGQYRP